MELITEVRKEEWFMHKILKIPDLFQFEGYGYGVDKEGVYVIDSRITEMPKEFHEKEKVNELFEEQIKS